MRRREFSSHLQGSQVISHIALTIENYKGISDEEACLTSSDVGEGEDGEFPSEWLHGEEVCSTAATEEPCVSEEVVSSGTGGLAFSTSFTEGQQSLEQKD